MTTKYLFLSTSLYIQKEIFEKVPLLAYNYEYSRYLLTKNIIIKSPNI